MSLEKLDLDGYQSLDEINNTTQAFTKYHPGIPRLLCRGWIQSATGGLATSTMKNGLNKKPICADSADNHSFHVI